MRKRWLWLLVLPILLCGAVFWAQKARWKRIEAEFRAALLQEYASPKMLGIEVSIGNSANKKSLGFLRRSEIVALAPQLFLQQSTGLAARSSNFPRIYFEGESTDFSVFLDKTLDEEGDDNVLFNWRRQKPLHLTPESCRVLRRHAMAVWGQQIAKIRREIYQKSP